MTEEAQAPAPAEPSVAPQEAPQQPQEAQIDAPQAESPNEAPKAPRTRREALENAFRAIDEGEGGAQPKAETSDRPRNPDGTFAPKAEATDKPAENPEEAVDKPAEAKEAKKPVAEPPSRFSADAKAAWKDAPESIRGEVNRAIAELESGIQQKDEILAPLKPFVDMAKQHGTTVHDAMNQYVRMEQALRNPQTRPQALQALAQNMGMTPADMAEALTGQQSEGGDNAKDREIVGLKQQLRQLQDQIGGVTQTMQQTREQQVQREIEAFATEHPRFDDLSEEILRLIQTGYAPDLASAYEIADRLNPAPQPAATPQPAPPAQPRPAQSVTGAPNAGSNPGNRQPSRTRGEAIARAISAVGL